MTVEHHPADDPDRIEQPDPDGGAEPPPPLDVAAPVAASGRIDALDTLRGFALLGILVMNAPFFALTSYAWLDPRRGGDFEGVNYATWLGGHLLFDMKMWATFTMLFGAGMVLFAEKAVAKRGRAVGLHYRRMLWLLAIGLLHAYVIWEGDILTMYALCAMIAYPLRFLRARWLLPIGVALLCVAPAMNVAQAFLFETARSNSEVMLELEAAGEAVPLDVAGWGEAWLGELDEETGERRDGMAPGFYPGEREYAEEREAVLGSFVDRIVYRAPDTLFFHTYFFFAFILWRVVGFMAIGMALYKLGVLTARRTPRFYAVMTAAGFGLGVPIIAFGVTRMRALDFDVIGMFREGMAYNYFGSVFVALGWVGLWMLVCRTGAIAPFRRALGAVGRTAFTNYIAQSLICGAIFFGWGFGLFGRLERFEVLLVVLGVWAFQIVASVLWLRRFRFGPLEWLWRSLTYWRFQPMRKDAGADG